MKPLGEELKGLAGLNLGSPIGSIGVLADYVGGRIQRGVRPDRITLAHSELKSLSDPVTDQVTRLRSISEGLLRRHGRDIESQQLVLKRVADATADIYAQVAVLSRVSHIFASDGVEPSGQERYIAETFCTRAAGRVKANLDKVERNDDERTGAIATLALKRGAYGYAFFED
jgi:acyl-CoA dehydrogenase family protein 9